MIKKKLRVLHYVTGFAETSGGIESFLFNMFSSFAVQQEIELSLLTRYCYVESEFYRKYIRSGFCVDSLRIKHLGLRDYRLLKNRLEDYFESHHFDILHMHGLDEPLVINTAKKFGVRRIIVHAHTPEMEMNGRRQWTKYIKMIWRNSNIKNSDYYVGCSKLILDKSFSYISKNRKYLIKNCIDTNQYRYSEIKRAKSRKELNIDESVCVIGHIGRLVDVKNQGWILQVIKKAVEKKLAVKAVIVGEGDKAEALREEAFALGIDSYIEFLGERIDIPDLMCGFDRFIFPSKFEGLGMTVVEAQACGLPCVISDTVPKEVIVTDLVKRISLNKNEDIWLDELDINKDIINREKYADIVSESGYGIEYINLSLSALYEGICNE